MAEAPNASGQVAEAELRAREAHYYRIFAAALCIAAIAFGLLNLWGVIKM